MAPKSKLSPAEIANARARKAADPTLTNQALAGELGVSRTTLEKALGPAELLPVAGAAVELDLAALRPSPLNPRRTFNADSIAALAETIAGQGLLQNLMVRRAASANLYDIVFGERRLRALQLLHEQGRWDKTVSCIIADIDDATHLALALLENVQREDVPTMEEAHGIARLHAMDPETYSTQAIAERIGRSMRYVQQRIAIATNLVAMAQRLLSEKLITIEGARLLASESHAVQLEALNAWGYDEIAPDTDFSGREAIEVNEIDWQIRNIRLRQDREKAEAARAAAPPPQAEMRLDNIAATEPRPRDEKSAVPPSKPKPEPETKQPVTKEHIYHAHRRKTVALRAALAQDFECALRVACMALLGPQSIACIHTTSPLNDDDPDTHGMRDKAIDATVKRILGDAKPPTYTTDGKAVKFWAHLQKVEGRNLEDLFAALIAHRVHTPPGFNALLGDDPLAEAIAKSLGIPGNEENHGLALQNEDLAGLRKPILLAIADETGAPAVNDSTKLAELTEAIAKKRKRHDYVIPTLRFGSTKSIEKALQELGK